MVNSLFKITSRLDLLSVDDVKQISNVSAPSEGHFHLSAGLSIRLKKCMAALFIARPLMNTH